MLRTEAKKHPLFMDLFIQHLLSQCVVRVRPQQSHVGYSFNVKTDTEAIAVKGR